MTCNIETDEDSIKILKRIKIIEDFYGVRFYRPDEFYERDVEKLTILNDLIEHGYTDKLKIGHKTSTNFYEKSTLKQFLKGIHKQKYFYVMYEGLFYCKLFGATFSLGNGVILAGKYHSCKRDIQYKIRTFKEGDSRRIAFDADEDFIKYFITDIDKFKNNVQMLPYEIFQVRKMDFEWRFIFDGNKDKDSSSKIILRELK